MTRTPMALAMALWLATAGCAGHARTPAPEVDSEREALDLEGPEEGLLYTVGAHLGRGLQDLALDRDEAEEVARGLVDAVTGEPLEYPLDFTGLPEVQEFRAGRLRVQSAIEEEAGRPLLEAAARQPGAELRESGMVLRVIEPGEGEVPEWIYDFVVMNYRGTLRDGQVFDANPEDEPKRFRVGMTMRCWQEALLAAGRPGAKLEIVCPPQLAFGDDSAPRLPGGSVVTYELEVQRVEAGTSP